MHFLPFSFEEEKADSSKDLRSSSELGQNGLTTKSDDIWSIYQSTYFFEEFQKIENEDDTVSEQQITKHNASEYPMDLVQKSFSQVSLPRAQSINPKEFFQLTSDVIVNLDYFRRIEDDRFYVDINNPLSELRPIRKIIKYPTYSMMITDTTSTGSNNFDMAINRLLDTHTSEAYDTAQLLMKLRPNLEQLEQYSKRLKSIFPPEQLQLLLERNYEESVKKVQACIEQLERTGQKDYSLVMFRVCPDSLQPKLQLFICSDTIENIVSCNELDKLNMYSLRKYFPNFIDIKSYLNIGNQVFLDKSTHQIYLTALDGEVIPCEVEQVRVPLCSAEISPGIALTDEMVVMRYKINPNIIANLNKKRATQQFKLSILCPEVKINNELQQRFYLQHDSNSNSNSSGNDKFSFTVKTTKAKKQQR